MKNVMGVVNKLRINDKKIEDQVVAEKVLKILPKNFEMVLTSLLDSKSLAIFSVE